VHGGIDPSLRKESALYLSSLDFDGYAIGGSLGKNRDEMVEVVTKTVPYLPIDKPNHLLGIGDLASIARVVPLGIDTFDSSYPTRAARHGVLLTQEGGIKIEKAEYAEYFEGGIDGCCCPTCKRFSLAYLHHLFKAGEMTAMTLATIHNLYFMVNLMRNYREAILDDRL